MWKFRGQCNLHLWWSRIILLRLDLPQTSCSCPQRCPSGWLACWKENWILFVWLLLCLFKLSVILTSSALDKMLSYPSQQCPAVTTAFSEMRDPVHTMVVPIAPSHVTKTRWGNSPEKKRTFSRRISAYGPDPSLMRWGWSLNVDWVPFLTELSCQCLTLLWRAARFSMRESQYVVYLYYCVTRHNNVQQWQQPSLRRGTRCTGETHRTHEWSRLDAEIRLGKCKYMLQITLQKLWENTLK